MKPVKRKPPKVDREREPSYPIRGGYGAHPECPDDGIITKACGGGRYKDCNGYSSTATCEKFNILKR